MRNMRALQLFAHVLRSTKPGRLLGLKVGTTGIGVAVSDLKFIHASPQCVIMRNENNIDEIALELKRLITEQSGLGLIVGHQHNRGRMKQNAQVNRLTFDLAETKILENVDYAFWEEGFTSKLAECVMHPLNPDPQREKRISDKLAATGMLQGYLDAVNSALRSDLEDSSDEDGDLN